MMLPLLLIAAQIECAGDIVDQIEASQGSPIALVLPENQSSVCSLSRPAKIDRPTTISGPGEWFLSIRAQAGAFHARAPLKLHGFSLWRADWATESAAIGVFGEAHVEVENVEFSGFTIGVYVWASASERGTNANGFRLRDMTIRGSGHAGIIVRGRDANAFNISSVRIYTSCEHATKWTAEYGPCANAVDRSFFGGHWDSMLLSTAGEIVAGQRTRKPAFLSIGASQHGKWSSVYCETDQSPSSLDKAAIAVGGLCNGITGAGMRIDGTSISGFTIVNAQDPARVVQLRAGRQAAPGSWLDYVAPWDTARPLRRQVTDPANKCYVERIANQTETSRTCQDGSTWISPPK